MNRTEAIKRHNARLANLTDTQVKNLMTHAANETPLLPIDQFFSGYERSGEC